MIILDSEKLKEYFKWISQGFQRTPLEITLAIIGILLILIIPPLFYIILKGRSKYMEHQSRKNEYENKLDALALTPDQQELLILMGEKAWQLRSNYERILNSISFFYWAGEEIIKEQLSDYTQLALISKKIPSLVNQAPPRLFSTANLKRNQKLFLPAKGGQKIISIIVETNDQGLRLQIPGNLKLPTTLKFNIQYQQDYYTFKTQILSQSDNQIFIAHSHDLSKIQKRHFFRIATHSPVILNWRNQDFQAETSIITELSGGGARIKLTNHEPLIGDSLILALVMSQNKLQINAHIVRIVKSEYFSVAFDALSETERDKIIKNLIVKKQEYH